MRRVLLVVVGLIGCRNGGDDFPVTVGATGAGGTVPAVDARPDTGDGGNLLGRVCLITDPRQPTSACATTGAGGLIVTLGASSATTADDGTFVITASTATGLVWDVIGADIIESLSPFTAQAIVPAMPALPFVDLETGNGIVPTPGHGAAFVRVVHGGTPVAGATVVATGEDQYAPLYDPETGLVWGPTATGAFGMAWLPSLLAGTQDITVVPPGQGTPVVVGNVPIVEGALTFVTAELL